MSKLLAIAYNNQTTASEALQHLECAQKVHLISFDDAVVVIRDQKGRTRLRQTYNLVAGATANAGLLALLVELFFTNPLVGVAAGDGLADYLVDVGINDGFVLELSGALTPGRSALFLLGPKAATDKALPWLREFGGSAVQTSLSAGQKSRIQQASAKRALTPVGAKASVQ